MLNYLVLFEVHFRVDTYNDIFFFKFLGMVVIHKMGNIAAGTSTNGIKFKIPGLVFLKEQISKICIECQPICPRCLGG